MNPDDNDDVFDRYATAAERAAYWEETAHRYERRLDASEAALRHADQINGELAQENNYLSDELATAVEMNKRLVKESDRSEAARKRYEKALRAIATFRRTQEARIAADALEEL